LYHAARAGHRVASEALADTTAWLLQPAGWDHNGGDGPFNDKRLARIAFTSALATAISTQWVQDRSALSRAADRLALDQAADGSWPTDGEETAGSPAAYGRVLATFLARQSLFAARETRLEKAIERADAWLTSRKVLTVTDAAVSLLSAPEINSPPVVAQRTLSLNLLRRAQSDDGGWGPHAESPPEPFDTAVALLGLANCARTAGVRAMIAKGREFLIAQLHGDGSWTETTRPAGNVSYAQRISTTGWATLALLRTSDASRYLGANAKPNRTGVGGDSLRDRVREINFERSADAVAGNIFQIGSNHQGIVTRSPWAFRGKLPGRLPVGNGRLSRHVFVPLCQAPDRNQTIQKPAVERFGESDEEGLVRILPW
jgi:hypothetical protein